MVEDIEELRTKFQIGVFPEPAERNVLDQGKVEIELARSLKNAATVPNAGWAGTRAT